MIHCNTNVKIMEKQVLISSTCTLSYMLTYQNANTQSFISSYVELKIQYCGLDQKIISRNLPSATNSLNTLTIEIENQIAED